MVFSKDMKSPAATSLSTVSTEAGEREQEEPSLAHAIPSRLFLSLAPSSPSSPPPHNGHNNAWEAELETHLLDEMRVVMLIPVTLNMTALQDMLREKMPKPPYQEALARIVNTLELLVDQLTEFHANEKNPTVNQRNAPRDIAHLVTRVPAALIATMQVARESDLPPTNPSLPEVYWAVETVNAVQEVVRELGKAFKKTSQHHRKSLMSLEISPLHPMIDLTKELGVELLTLERQLIDDQDAYSTEAERKTWKGMRDDLKGKAYPRPETVETHLSEIEQLRDELASDNKTRAKEYRALSVLIGHILDTRVQNPRELHAVNLLATLALDIASILQCTARDVAESDIEGMKDAVTAPGLEKALTDVLATIDTAKQLIFESGVAGALKNAPLFEAEAPLSMLKKILSSMKVNVSQQIPLYEREQRRVSLETLRETLKSKVTVDPETSGEWGVYALIQIAGVLLSLEKGEDRRDDSVVITLAKTLSKLANGVLSAMAMRSAAPEGVVTAKMLEYAESKAKEGAEQAEVLMISRVNRGAGIDFPQSMREHFKSAAAALKNARHQLSSETRLQKVAGEFLHQGRRGLLTLNKVVSTVSDAQLNRYKWIAAALHARSVSADVQRNLRACIYPVVEALTMLKMAAGLERESLKFNKHYGSTGRSKDAKYDAASFERYRQASVNAGRAFPWVQAKITVLRSTLLALYEESGDAGTTAVIQEFMVAVIPPLADFDTLPTDWEVASKLQSTHGMDEVIRKIGAIKSAIKKDTEWSVGAPQGIRSDESKSVRHLGEFLAGEKAKHLAEHPQEGALFDKKVSELLQQHATELAPARDGDMAQLIQDAYIAADNNMQLHLPTTEDVVKGVPGFWTKLAGSGPMSLVRRMGKIVASGTADTLFLVTGTYTFKVALSISLKTLMFLYSLYRVNDALERARKPWEPEEVTAAARWAVTDKLFRQYLFRIAKTALPSEALKILLPVGQTAYLLTRGDGKALLSEKVTVGKVAEEAGWFGGSEGVSRGMSAGMKAYNNSERTLNSNEIHAEVSVPDHNDQSSASESYGTDKKAGRVKRHIKKDQENINDRVTTRKEIDSKINYSQYNDLPEDAKVKTYFYAMNYVLHKIKNDMSIPQNVRGNVHRAIIGEKRIVPVDIYGYRYTNAFFIPDEKGSKKGVLVNLNNENNPYAYIGSGKDIPIELIKNVDVKSSDTGGANGDYYVRYNPKEWLTGFKSVRNGDFDFNENFNYNNPNSVDIYEMAERLARDFKKIHSNGLSDVRNEQVLKQAIVGSEIPAPEVHATPVKYNMGVTWAALTPSEYLRSFAQPFSTLGGQLQQIASHVAGDDIQNTEKKIEQAKYIGAWVDVTVSGAIVLVGGPAGVPLVVAQSVAGVAADILEGKEPDPFDVAGIILSVIPAGKISARIGKFSKIGAKGFKYTLQAGETTLDLVDVGRSLKNAQDPLSFYQALSGTGITIKGAKDIYESVKKPSTAEETSSVEKQEITINSKEDTKTTSNNKDINTASGKAAPVFKGNPRKFHVGKQEILGRKKDRYFEVSIDGGLNWKEGNKVQLLAYALQNAGGVPKLPADKGGSNDNVEQGRETDSRDTNGEDQENQNPGMEGGLNKHLEDGKNPDEYFYGIKNGALYTEVSTFSFFNRSLNGRVRNGTFEVSRDGGLTWKKGWWLQEAVWRIKYRGGERKEVLSEDLDKKINKASRKDPTAYSFSCYRAAFNDATQAGVINAKQADWLNNTVTKKDGRGEIMDSQHYRQTFGLQSKKPLTTFNSANIRESGFIHVGERRPDGSLHYDHVVYVHVANNEIHLYQANGSEFLLTLNGSDANGKNNNIGKHTSKSHYKHHMNEDRISLFNKYFENDGGKDGSQPVFVFTPASEVRKNYTERHHSEIVSPSANANGVGSDLDAQKVNAETSKNSLSSTVSESNIKEDIMDITKGMPDLESILAKPSEKCETSTGELSDRLKLTYPNTERVQLLLFKSVKEAATNHYAVRVTIDGKHYISDPTISQFWMSAPGVIGTKEVFVGTESEWLDKIKAAHPNFAIVKSESNTPQTNIFFEDANGTELVRPEWVNKQFSVVALLVVEKRWFTTLHVHKYNERFRSAILSDRFKKAVERTFFSNPPEETYKGLGLNVRLFKRVSMRSKNKRILSLTSTKALENMSVEQRNAKIEYLKEMRAALLDELKLIDLNSVQLNYIDDLSLALMDVNMRSSQLKSVKSGEFSFDGLEAVGDSGGSKNMGGGTGGGLLGGQSNPKLNRNMEPDHQFKVNGTLELSPTATETRSNQFQQNVQDLTEGVAVQGEGAILPPLDGVTNGNVAATNEGAVGIVEEEAMERGTRPRRAADSESQTKWQENSGRQKNLILNPSVPFKNATLDLVIYNNDGTITYHRITPNKEYNPKLSLAKNQRNVALDIQNQIIRKTSYVTVGQKFDDFDGGIATDNLNSTIWIAPEHVTSVEYKVHYQSGTDITLDTLPPQKTQPNRWRADNRVDGQHGDNPQEIRAPSSDEVEKSIETGRTSLTKLNDPILTPSEGINKFVSKLINGFNNRPENKNKQQLHPDDKITVNFTNKDRRVKNIKPAGAGKKMFKKIKPDYSIEFKLKDIVSGTYWYEFSRKNNINPEDYAADIKSSDRVINFINSVDRNKLQSDLQDGVSTYFNKNSKDSSKFFGDLMHTRIFEYNIQHGDDNEFSHLLSDFYAGKIPANDLYIDGVRVPGMFSFTLGEGLGAKTLVLSIYTEKSFVFEMQNAQSMVYGQHGSAWRNNFTAYNLLAPSHWDDFDKVVLKALPLYEKHKYPQQNPFNYRLNPPKKKGEPHVMSFRSGSYRKDMPQLIMNDIKNKLIKDYDAHIYSDNERNFDNVMRMAQIMVTPLSLAAGAAVGGPLGFTVALGIDVTYVGAKVVQAEMSDNPERSEELRSEAIWDAVILTAGATAGGIVGNLDEVVKKYRSLKLARKNLRPSQRPKPPKPHTGRGALAQPSPENGRYIGQSVEPAVGNRPITPTHFNQIFSRRFRTKTLAQDFTSARPPTDAMGQAIIQLAKQNPIAGSAVAGMLAVVGSGLTHDSKWGDMQVDARECKTFIQETEQIAETVAGVFDDPDMNGTLETTQEFFFGKGNHINKKEFNQIRKFLLNYKKTATPAQLQHLYRSGQLKEPLPDNIPNVLRRIPIQRFDWFVLFMGTRDSEPNEFSRNLYEIQNKNEENYSRGSYTEANKSRALLDSTMMHTDGVLNAMNQMNRGQLDRIQDHYFGKGNHISKAEIIQIKDFLLYFKKTASEDELKYLYNKWILPNRFTDGTQNVPQAPEVFTRISINQFSRFVTLTDLRNSDPDWFNENYIHRLDSDLFKHWSGNAQPESKALTLINNTIMHTNRAFNSMGYIKHDEYIMSKDEAIRISNFLYRFRMLATTEELNALYTTGQFPSRFISNVPADVRIPDALRHFSLIQFRDFMAYVDWKYNGAE